MATPKAMFGSNIINQKGENVADIDQAGRVIGIYFSAHWCPPCRGFTPKLAEWYNSVKASGKNIEIVFVTSDRDEQSFKEYYATMPWLAIDFEEDKIKPSLKTKYSVRGIPSLIFINGTTGETISADGRTLVMGDTSFDGAGLWK